MTETSTLEPEPKSLKIPDLIALATRAIASARWKSAGTKGMEGGEAYSHVLLEAGLEYSHGSQTTTSHGHIR